MAATDRLDAYRLLGIHPGSDADTIRSAWRRLVRQYHPDLARTDPEAANARMAEINRAFDLLCDVSANGPDARPRPKRPQKHQAPPRRPHRQTTEQDRTFEDEAPRASETTARSWSLDERAAAKRAAFSFAEARSVFDWSGQDGAAVRPD